METPSILNYEVPESTLFLIKEALLAGLENSQELLLKHDSDLGRTTRSNRRVAELLEQDISTLRQALSKMPEMPKAIEPPTYDASIPIQPGLRQDRPSS